MVVSLLLTSASCRSFFSFSDEFSITWALSFFALGRFEFAKGQVYLRTYPRVKVRSPNRQERFFQFSWLGLGTCWTLVPGRCRKSGFWSVVFMVLLVFTRVLEQVVECWGLFFFTEMVYASFVWMDVKNSRCVYTSQDRGLNGVGCWTYVEVKYSWDGFHIGLSL